MNKKELLDKKILFLKKIADKHDELVKANTSQDEITETIRKLILEEQENNPEIIDPNVADRSSLSLPK